MAWLISIRTLGLGIGFRSADVCFKSFPGRRASLGLISRELAAQTAVYLFLIWWSTGKEGNLHPLETDDGIRADALGQRITWKVHRS